MTVRLFVRLTPRGGSDSIDGVVSGVLRVRVAAAPVDGAANEALERLLARRLGVPRTAVRVVGGATARVKTVEIAGVEGADLRREWPDLG